VRPQAAPAEKGFFSWFKSVLGLTPAVEPAPVAAPAPEAKKEEKRGEGRGERGERRREGRGERGERGGRDRRREGEPRRGRAVAEGGAGAPQPTQSQG